MRMEHYHTMQGIMLPRELTEDPKIISGTIRFGELDHEVMVDEELKLKRGEACSVREHVPGNLRMEWPRQLL